MEILILIVIVLCFYANSDTNRKALEKLDKEADDRHRKQMEEQEDYKRSFMGNFDL